MLIIATNKVYKESVMNNKDMPPLSIQLKKEGSVKVTPSFLLGLIALSSKSKIETDEDIENLKSKINLKSARVLTGDDIFKLAGGEKTAPGIPSMINQPSESTSSEESVWSSPSDLSLITDVEQLLDVVEYVFADKNIKADAYDAIVMLRNLIRLVSEGEKLSPAQVEEVVTGLKHEPSQPLSKMKVEPGETDVMLSTVEHPSKWGKSPEEFLAGLTPPVKEEGKPLDPTQIKAV